MKYLYLLFMIIVVFFTGCTEALTTNSSGLVVEGWIDDGGFPVVFVTSTIPVSDKYQSIDSIGKYVIKWARVTVSDGDTTVVLTGKADRSYFPDYIYTTGWLRGRAGKSYTLTVDYDDFHASASTTIPGRIPVDSFRVERSSLSDTLYRIKAFFTDPPAERNYYKFFTKRLGKDKNYYSSLFGTFSDAVLDTLPAIPVLRGNGILTAEKYSPYFTAQDDVVIKFAQLDAASYSFWHDFESSVNLSRNFFMPDVNNLRSNVKGALGYWCGYGASYYVVNIKDSIKARRGHE